MEDQLENIKQRENDHLTRLIIEYCRELKQ